MPSLIILRFFIIITSVYICYKINFIYEKYFIDSEVIRLRRIFESGAEYSTSIFQRNNVFNFSAVAYDMERDQMIVGARDYIFRLALKDLSVIEEVHWPAESTPTELCLDLGLSDNECRNHVKVANILNDTVLVCGTNAFRPVCTWRGLTNISGIISSLDGRFNVPFNPSHSVTSVLTEEGNHYVGTYINFQGSDWGILRALGPKQTMRTKESTYEYLYQPSFVASFEIGGFIYFFFTELALESATCGVYSYPRIGRICKDDIGGQRQAWRFSWLTFLKARLNCSIPGQHPFFYSRLQDAVYLPDEDIIYAVFTTQENAPVGSAVCLYRMSAVNASFDGEFLRHLGENLGGTWIPMREPANKTAHYRCEPEALENERQSFIPLAEDYVLMKDMVHPVTNYPVFTIEHDRLTHIIAESVDTLVSGRVPLLYLCNDNGTIYKISLIPDTPDTATANENETHAGLLTQKTYCLLDVFNPFPVAAGDEVKFMNYIHETDSLYLGSENYVMKIDTVVCQRFESKASCLNSGDPHCGWNTATSQCTAPPNNNFDDPSWVQEFLRCDDPIPDIKPPPQSSNGGWSKWSSWKRCENVASSRAPCLYRERQCNNPPPEAGGGRCRGVGIQVSSSGKLGSAKTGTIAVSVAFFLFLHVTLLAKFL